MGVQFLLPKVQAEVTLSPERGGGAAAIPALAPGVELAHAGDGGRVGAATADVHNVFAAQRLNNAGPIHGVFVVMAQFPVVACDTKEDVIKEDFCRPIYSFRRDIRDRSPLFLGLQTPSKSFKHCSLPRVKCVIKLIVRLRVIVCLR